MSARDHRDMDEEQMEVRPDGLVQYKDTVPDRQGQLISLWDESRFIETFGDKFEIKKFVAGEEIEAVNNPDKKAKFTTMVAVRKPIEP